MRARTFAALLVALVMAGPSLAQEQRGSIEGVVKDSSGAVLPGVTVEAKAANGARDQRPSATAAASTASRPSPPALTRSRATLQGFAPAKVRDVDVGLGQIKKVDLALALAGVTETVQVTAESPLVDVQAERAADQHPRRAGRAAAEGPRLHDARHAGAGRQPGSEARRPLDRRRERRREPLHHRRHRDDQPAERPLGQEPDRRLRRRGPGQVERLHGGVRRRDRRRDQRHHQERHQRLPRQRAVQLPGQQPRRRRQRGQRRLARRPTLRSA